jgi:acyl-CoA synthetase (AMP-forming)/AMP-acid ligase II
LQYTSGSTGRPRGVVLSHANLMHNLQQIGRRFGMHADSRGVNWLPPYHDMGLIGAILECVAVGCRGTLMTPLALLRRPARWLEAISRERGTISGGPNFAYDLCVKRVTPEERSRLDLSSWEVAFVGAEPVRSATLERFAATFAECGFRRAALYPCYGLAEATLMVAGGERLGGFTSRTYDGRSVVSCGPPIDGAELRILDAATGARCADGAVGEITVRGPSVARGYWESIGVGEADVSHTEWLRTGDLGFVADGELYVTGRSKAVIIVNGRKVHAEDVERTVAESHARGWPGGVAALGLDPGVGSEAVVVFQEIDWRRIGAIEPADLERTIRATIAEQHQLAVARIVLLRPGQIPRTSSGKVRREVLRDMYLAGQLT